MGPTPPGRGKGVRGETTCLGGVCRGKEGGDYPLEHLFLISGGVSSSTCSSLKLSESKL